uniref:Uncharacterized protein n=1 Tax=Rhizophora mucronata TaxID=61149 RepID=A0A2P2R4A5_RHIMU
MAFALDFCALPTNLIFLVW